MIYGYIRVSSQLQCTDNQRYEITNFCKASGLRIDHWIEEHISGTTSYQERALGSLLKGVGRGDLIICSELSRLGRSLFIIMEVLSLCMQKGCSVWTIKDNYRLGDDLSSKVLAFAFALSAEIERTLISQRTREALSRLKSEGKQLGRPRGAVGRTTKLHYDREGIALALQRGESKSAVARRYGVSRPTLRRFIEREGLGTSSPKLRNV